MRAPRDAAVQHCLEYLGSEHPDFELEGSVRLVVQFECILPEAGPCVAYAPIDLDGQVGILVDVPPEVYKLVRLGVHLARCLYAECGGGLRHFLSSLARDLSLGLQHGEAKRSTHDHDHPRHLPQLLGGLSDDPGIVSGKHAPKRRRQDRLSDSCFPPLPRPLFVPQVHQRVHDAFVRLETGVGHVYNRRKEYVEWEGREHAPFAKAPFHSELPRSHPVAKPHACSHAIVELTNDRDHVLWHAKTGGYCPEDGSVNAVVRLGKHTYNGICFLRANSCSQRNTNIISAVERFGRKPLCSSGRIPKRS